MASPLMRSGDPVLLTVVVSLLLALAYLCFASELSVARILAVLAGVLLLAIGTGWALARWREGIARSPVLLRPRRREAALVSAFLTLLAGLIVGLVRIPPEVLPPPLLPSHTQQVLVDWVDHAADPVTKRARDHVAQAIKEANADDPTAGGRTPEQAERNREEKEKMVDWSVDAAARIAAGQPVNGQGPASGSQPALPETLRGLPPPPSGGGSGNRLLRDLLSAITGPVGSLVADLLGLSSGGGYRREVIATVQQIKGGQVPTVDQIDRTMGTAESPSAAPAIAGRLAQIGRKSGLTPEQQRELGRNLSLALARDSRVVREILEELVKNPEAPNEVLLSHLEGGKTANPEQQRLLQEALIQSGHPQVWQRLAAALGTGEKR